MTDTRNDTDVAQINDEVKWCCYVNNLKVYLEKGAPA
tara:strand:+ start:7849 stop:7959 length:111 start_codon:yes stop_codon:yes gene_type:complete